MSPPPEALGTVISVASGQKFVWVIFDPITRELTNLHVGTSAHFQKASKLLSKTACETRFPGIWQATKNRLDTLQETDDADRTD